MTEFLRQGDDVIPRNSAEQEQRARIRVAQILIPDRASASFDPATDVSDADKRDLVMALGMLGIA